MSLNRATSKALWWGAAVGILVIALGLALESVGMGERVLWTGILILIISPMLGVAVSMVSLIKEKDSKWAGVALLLIIMTAVATLVSSLI